LQSGVPAGPSSRPLDRLAAPLAIPSPQAAAAVVVVTAPPVPVTAAIAAREPLIVIFSSCRARGERVASL
jgi:hypothetical protein